VVGWAGLEPATNGLKGLRYTFASCLMSITYDRLQNQLPKQLTNWKQWHTIGPMKAQNSVEQTEPANIIKLKKTRAPRVKGTTRFKVKEFENASGTTSWRLEGIKLDGTRVRMNFADKASAQVKATEFELEFLQQDVKPSVRATRLTEDQISLAESAFLRLGADLELPLAVEYWITHGRGKTVSDSPKLDDAVLKFTEWLDTSSFRDRTRTNLSTRLNVFKNSLGNLRVSDITQATIDAFLDGRKVSAATKDNDRRAVSRFFSWCMDRKRRWTSINPCHGVKVETDGETTEPTVLPVDECKSLFLAAENHKGGALAPYVAVCLLAGLRPYEARRLTWANVNLKDGEIRLEASMTKTKRPRVIEISATLRAWLEAYEGVAFFPANWRRDFDAVKKAVGYGEAKPWVEDVLRHTAISHYFRLTGSYGKTAEAFGNSEKIIKDHYQGRVTSEDTTNFYAILPTKKGAK